MKITDITKGDYYRKRISELENTCDNQIKEIEKLTAELCELKKQNTQLSVEMQSQEWKLKSLTALYDFQKAEIPACFEKLQEQWAYWDLDIHYQPYQIERQNRSCMVNYTPLKLLTKNAGGYFRGRERDYWTTLVNCECQDFQRRQLPCKHMYRLAYEFDVFMPNWEVSVHPHPEKIMNLYTYKEALKHLPASLATIYDDLKVSEIIICDTYSAKKLIAKGLASICDNKKYLLASYKKEELLSLLPEAITPSIKKYKKDELIDFIITEYDSAIAQIEKLTVAICLSENVKHLVL